MVQANHLKLLDLIGPVDILNMTMARIVVFGLYLLNGVINESRVKILYRECNKSYHFAQCDIAQIIFPQKLAPRRTPKTGPLTGVRGLNKVTSIDGARRSHRRA